MLLHISEAESYTIFLRISTHQGYPKSLGLVVWLTCVVSAVIVQRITKWHSHRKHSLLTYTGFSWQSHCTNTTNFWTTCQRNWLQFLWTRCCKKTAVSNSAKICCCRASFGKVPDWRLWLNYSSVHRLSSVGGGVHCWWTGVLYFVYMNSWVIQNLIKLCVEKVNLIAVFFTEMVWSGTSKWIGDFIRTHKVKCSVIYQPC